jgi:hypothetical protein
MSRRAWITLLGLFVLSLLIAAVAILVMQQVRTNAPFIRPGFGIPWGRPGFEPRTWGGSSRPFFWAQHSPWWLLGQVVASEVFLFVIGSLVLLLFPARLRVMLAALSERGRASGLLGLGFLTGILFLVLGALAVFSLIGLAFLPLLFLLVALATGLGLVAVTLRVGARVRQAARIEDYHPLLDLALGVLVFFIVGSVPILGGLALFLAAAWGLGAVVTTRFGSPDGWHLDITMEE